MSSQPEVKIRSHNRNGCDSYIDTVCGSTRATITYKPNLGRKSVYMSLSVKHGAQMLTGPNFAEIESHLQDNAEAIAIIRAVANLCYPFGTTVYGAAPTTESVADKASRSPK